MEMAMVEKAYHSIPQAFILDHAISITSNNFVTMCQIVSLANNTKHIIYVNSLVHKSQHV